MLTPSSLKAIRALSGLSQVELAEKAGVSPASVANFETGKSDIRASTINKLCGVLDVRVKFIVGDVEITGP